MILVHLIVVIALVGLAVWAINSLIPMPPQFKNAIVVVAIVCIVLYVLSAFGLLDGIVSIPVPHAAPCR